MRIGMGVGPFYVSAGSGRKRRRRSGRPGLTWWGILLFLVLVFGTGLGTTAAVWLIWIGVPVLIVAELVHRSQRRRKRTVVPPVGTL
jgi:Flp pilus assembly protein TadB